MSRSLIGSALLVFAAPALSQAADAVYDGAWIGSLTCSEHLDPGRNARNIQGFSHRITLMVASRSGQANFDDASDHSRYTMSIGSDSSVSIQGSGARKENTNRSWSIGAKGRIAGDRLNAVGPMLGGDGKTVVRDRCEFAAQNMSMQARLDADKARAAAVVSTPSPSIATATAKAEAPRPTVTDEVSRSSPPPVPVAAGSKAPARVAAIANVDQPSDRAKNSLSKVTSNPVDSIKRTGANDVWINFNPSITVQERQFCRLVENYRADLKVAELSKNQIKVNEAVKAFSQAINALLPDGQYQGWVMRSISVAQASDGSADVIFELPCNVYVGSNTCDPNPKNFYGTVPENSRIYSELAKMTVNDFALVSGRFVYTDDKAFDRTRSVMSYGYSKTAAHCKAKVMAANADFFGTSINVLSTIK